MKKTMKRRIEFLSDDTLEVGFLGEMGWHSKAIANATHLTPCQVNYRLHEYGIKRRDYRDGTSWSAKQAVAACRPIIKPKTKNLVTPKFK